MQVKELHEADQQLPMFCEPRTGRSGSPGWIHDICLARVEHPVGRLQCLANKVKDDLIDVESIDERAT